MYASAMDRTGIRDLRADAAAIVRRAGGGERVIITVAGRPVALELPERVRCELEIEPDGDEVEVEIALRWPRPAP